MRSSAVILKLGKSFSSWEEEREKNPELTQPTNEMQVAEQQAVESQVPAAIVLSN